MGQSRLDGNLQRPKAGGQEQEHGIEYLGLFFGMAPAREKTALALSRMEKQLFLTLAYFVRKRLVKRLLLV